MELTVPIFVRTIKQKGKTSYVVKLVFGDTFTEGAVLSRAMNRLNRKVKEQFEAFGTTGYHRQLASTLFYPSLKSHKVDLTIEWKTKIERRRFCLISFERFGRQIVFNPLLRDLYFCVNDDEDLKTRAAEVYSHFFRQEEKADGNPPDEYAIPGEFWISDITVQVRNSIPTKKDSKLLSLWDSEEMNGATELSKVGRCLDFLYPEDLAESIDRDSQVNQLYTLLQSIDKRPVLVVGKSMVGKTALLHQVVRKRIEERSKKGSHSNNVWSVTGPRIISGMSYVGQWENRMKVILAEVVKKNHVLFCDDLLGLFRSGRTAGSVLSVGDKIKEAILDRTIRFMGEITPDALEKLNEVDRTFVDQFHILRLEPTNETETLRIGFQAARKSESENRCRFQPQAIFQIAKMSRQFSRNESFPGKLVKAIEAIGIKNEGKSIGPESVQNHFQQTTGLSLSLLNEEVLLTKKELKKKFEEKIIGQKLAVETCSDVISTVKAKLNDPRKPLSTLLFVGPTGVGKTECAKALSQLLSDREDRLIRFDLNEFKSAYAAARLVGTADRPDGLLTSVVRNKPCSILLFDEIEKAHPDVFDILLQVFGEGRLTDANGLTTDFTGCIIVMTSNLGTATSGRKLGFGAQDPVDHFTNAAKAFFRPEFFNRIDKIVPFHSLTQKEISQIARHMMQKVVSRDGLVRRQCILQASSDAIANVIASGYSPALGARALKRTIESVFTRPVAKELAKSKYDVPTVIRLSGNESSGSTLGVEVYSLENATQVPRPEKISDRQWVIDRCQSFLTAARELILKDKPEGTISADGTSEALLRFYSNKELLDSIQLQVKDLETLQLEIQDAKIRPMISNTPPKKRYHFKPERDVYVGRNFLTELNSSKDILNLFERQFQLIAQEKENSSMSAESAMNHALVNQCALLEAILNDPADDLLWLIRFSDCVDEFELQAFNRSIHHIKELEKNHGFQVKELLNQESTKKPNDRFFLAQISGAGIHGIMKAQQGVQLVCNDLGKLGMVQSITISPQELSGSVDSISQDQLEEEVIDIINGRPVGKVLQLIDHKNRILDFRTGETAKVDFLRALPLPGCFWE